MKVWYDFKNAKSGVVSIPDLTGNGGTLQLGNGVPGNPSVPTINNGLLFDRVDDIASCPTAKAGAFNTQSDLIYEIIFKLNELTQVQTLFCLGTNIDANDNHGAVQYWPASNQLQFFAKRNTDGATLQINIPSTDLASIGTYMYLLYYAGARQVALRYGVTVKNYGPSGVYGNNTSNLNLHLGSYSLGGGGRYLDGGLRHFAIYRAGQRFGSANLFTGATSQFNIFAGLGYL
jgi:hypothetical protein